MIGAIAEGVRPEGLTYRNGFITPGEESELIAQIDPLTFDEVRMHGVVAKRMTIHYGWSYDYEGWRIAPTDPAPQWLEFLLARSAEAAGMDRGGIEQVMIAKYPAGASIGWHRDAPMFGTPVIGVSLLSPCRMRFRRKVDDGWETHAQLLEARSLYVLAGAARSHWQHSIPKTEALRYSITMRTLRKNTTPPRTTRGAADIA